MPVSRTPCSAVEASKHFALSWARATPSCCEVEETRALGGLATEHHALHPETRDLLNRIDKKGYKAIT